MSTLPVVYRISGSLPASWEDFFCADGRYPHATIYTKAEVDSLRDEFGDPPAGVNDGWLDIVVDVDCIDLDVARLALADALGIDNPEDIVIEQAGVCQSV